MNHPSPCATTTAAGQAAYPKRWMLIAEFVVLMIALPVVMATVMPAAFVLPVLWVVGFCCWRALPLHHETSRLQWRWSALNWPLLAPLLCRFALSAAALLALTLWLRPELLFSFVRQMPKFWALVMIMYPFFSVLAQEVIFRAFFFSRYRSLFAHNTAMMLASALAFGIAHLLFHNWVAPLLCVIGGWFFADTYRRSDSLALVVLEHALYGDFIFTLGLGQYFYHGAVHATT